MCCKVRIIIFYVYINDCIYFFIKYYYNDVLIINRVIFNICEIALRKKLLIFESILFRISSVLNFLVFMFF